MDPASGLDAVRHVGIRGGTIAAVSATPLTRRQTSTSAASSSRRAIIDPHAHWQTLEGNRYRRGTA